MHKLEPMQAEQQNSPQRGIKINTLGEWQEEENMIFDLADPIAIAANQHSELTKAQITMFQRVAQSSWWFPPLIIATSGIMLFINTVLKWQLSSQFYIFLIIWLLSLAVLYMGYLPFSILTRKYILKRAKARGNVESMTGEVIKAGWRTVAHSEGRRLKVMNKAYPLPLEGRYHFFVLAGSNYILSAQSLNDAEPGVIDPQTRECVLVRLSQANNFTLDELALNREGCLSERQRARLLFISVKAGLGGLLAFIGLIVGIYVLIAWNLPQFSWWVWVGAFIIGLTLAALAFAGFTFCVLAAQERHNGRVISMDAPIERMVSVTASSNSSSASYAYNYEDFHYKVSKEAYRTLVPGLRYRVYHTPRQHRLMSIEPLDGPERANSNNA